MPIGGKHVIIFLLWWLLGIRLLSLERTRQLHRGRRTRNAIIGVWCTLFATLFRCSYGWFPLTTMRLCFGLMLGLSLWFIARDYDSPRAFLFRKTNSYLQSKVWTLRTGTDTFGSSWDGSKKTVFIPGFTLRGMRSRMHCLHTHTFYNWRNWLYMSTVYISVNELIYMQI